VLTELTCQEFVELVTDYLEGALPVSEQVRFERHLDNCDDCPIYLDQMRRTIRVLGTLQEEQITPAAKEELLHRFRDWKRGSGAPPSMVQKGHDGDE